ncbi:hypothetical protein PUN28_014396 [Cardiocondyla obscurior]|uniref:Secreted protein n=1 Tax=Cardiocondyla obscurior TaxID=286306 RepID=A0AAW2F4Z7_9HYME
MYLFMRQPVHFSPPRVSAASVSTVLYHRRETRTKRRVQNEGGIHLDLLLPFLLLLLAASFCRVGVETSLKSFQAKRIFSQRCLAAAVKLASIFRTENQPLSKLPLSSKCVHLCTVNRYTRRSPDTGSATYAPRTPNPFSPFSSPRIHSLPPICPLTNGPDVREPVR